MARGTNYGYYAEKIFEKGIDTVDNMLHTAMAYDLHMLDVLGL